MMRKPAFAWALCLALLLSFWPQATSHAQENRFILSGELPEVVAGTTGTLRFEMKNTGFAASNISITGLSAPLSLVRDDASGEIPIGSLATGETKTIELPVTCEATQQSYAIVSLAVTFTALTQDPQNPTGPYLPQKQTVNVPLSVRIAPKGETKAPAWQLTAAGLEKSQLAPGETTLLTLVLEAPKDIAPTRTLSLLGTLFAPDGLLLVDPAASLVLNPQTPSDFMQFETLSDTLRLTLRLRVQATAQTVSGSRTLIASLSGEDGKAPTETVRDVAITLANSAAEGITVENIEQVTHSATRFSLLVTLVNRGKAQSAPVSALELPAGVSLENASAHAGLTLEAGERKTISLSFVVDANTTALNYPLTVRAGAAERSFVAYLHREAAATPRPDVAAPDARLILAAFSTDPQAIIAGQAFELTFTLENTSAKAALSQIKLQLISADGIFQPEEGANSFYTASIGAGGRETFTIRLLPAISAQDKTYGLSLSGQYQDEDGSTQTLSLSLGLPVTQPMDIEIGEFTSEPLVAGDFSAAAISLINRGHGQARNILLELEGSFETTDGFMSFYRGTFAPSSREWIELDIAPPEAGELIINATLTYEDASGKTYTTAKRFTQTVEAPPAKPTPTPVPADTKPQSVNWLRPLLYVLAISALGVIVLLVVRQSIARRKLEARLLDDKDDI